MQKLYNNYVYINNGTYVWDNLYGGVWDIIEFNVLNNVISHIEKNIWSNVYENVGSNVSDNVWDNIYENVYDIVGYKSFTLKQLEKAYEKVN